MRLTFLLLFISVFHFLNAQQLSPEALSSGGDEYSLTSSSVCWTLGELMIETYSDGSSALTQGFHQTFLTVSADVSEVKLPYKLEIFPNPVCYRLSLNSEKEDINYRLCDINGKLYSEGRTDSKTYQIDLSSYPSGIFILMIDQTQSFKIIKK